MSKNNIDIFQAVRLKEEDNYFAAIDKIDINVQDEDGQSLLHEAISHNSIELGLNLVLRGINVNIQDRNLQTPLHFAALYNSVELANAIVRSGGNINLRDVHGNNALWTAVFNCKGKHYDIVTLFVENGGDILTKNKHGKSPLDFANQVKNEKLIGILLRNQST